ncbi:membrane-targeted effector domain-containing toxin [Pseudomonas lactucae]|uniref:Membrane-targeted effector domain-containing toxin n=1 Tax=Pseudomonas lactucae TaxID=2813360 RepID=A0A9X0Y8R0_9PSED|nr:membrane-targeted effector domain-containing toxin [Pseudomonas lactucae]MBN2974634.1 membrane-targeted effector domain-containing toxin [Pseudomonas lactucae]MBN2986342.1 membrane-targeted effector domain-containing toxin [Pseudomonas lactucae]
MTTSSNTSFFFEQLKTSLNQIAQSTGLLENNGHAMESLPPELGRLKRYNEQLLLDNRQVASAAKLTYQNLAGLNLKGAAGTLLRESTHTALNARLAYLEQQAELQHKPRKNRLMDIAVEALLDEAKLKVKNSLLAPSDQALVERTVGFLPPASRPGTYALTFEYRAQNIEFAGAFVLTTLREPVRSLATDVDVGPVLLFTPTRGLESFDSLRHLDETLLQCMQSLSSRNEVLGCLPRQYQHLHTAAIWPIELSAIGPGTVTEHTYNALHAKRTQDIAYALSSERTPELSPRQLVDELDRALAACQLDLSLRLDLYTRSLQERTLLLAAPDWYRSATAAQRQQLARHFSEYEASHQETQALFGKGVSPQACARLQLLERLERDHDYDDLHPDQLIITTRRQVAGVGTYQDSHTLVELVLRGLHVDDDKPGSDFLNHSVLSYQGQSLPQQYEDLSIRYLIDLTRSLSPRLDFAEEQRRAHSQPALKQALQTTLDRRTETSNYLALLHGHITADEHEWLRGRQQNDQTLKAKTVKVHGAQLKDVMVLCRTDAQGEITRVLLYTPGAPRDEQLKGFNSEQACKDHIYVWFPAPGMPGPYPMADYLFEQVLSRFRQSLKKALHHYVQSHTQPDDIITFETMSSYADCLNHMVDFMLVTQEEEETLTTPSWLRSCSSADRQLRLTLADDAHGAEQTYQNAFKEHTRFPDFDSFLLTTAKTHLNALLGNPAGDVDPRDVWFYPSRRPTDLLADIKSFSYLELFRDGYDAFGLKHLIPLYHAFDAINRNTVIKAPAGVDLKGLTLDKAVESAKGIWIGERYVEAIKHLLINPNDPRYSERRTAVLSVQQLQMKSCALESRLCGHIATAEQRWLVQSIESLGDNSPATRQRFKIYPLQIDSHVIDGCYVFTYPNEYTLLYTPNAPDGIAFRRAKLFNYMLKNISGIIDYYCARCLLRNQLALRNFLESSKGSLPAQDPTTPGRPLYDAPEHAGTALPLLNEPTFAFYNNKLQFIIDNVKATTTSRLDAVMNVIWSCVDVLEIVLAVVTIPFPPLSLAVGAAFMFKDAMLALIAYTQGDKEAAFGHYLAALANAAGGLLTDLKPTLRALGKFNKLPARPIFRTVENSNLIDAVQRLQPPNPAHPRPSFAAADMQPVVYNGETFWASRTADPLGRFLLYRYDAVTQSLQSTARLVNKNVEGKWVRSGARGGAPTRPTVADTPLDRYEMPEQHRRKMTQVLNPNYKRDLTQYSEALDLNIAPSLVREEIESLRPVRERYLLQVDQLTRDANQYFRDLEPLIPRADVLTVEPSASHASIIEQLFKESNGLVIGETHHSIASKKFLIDNMPTLSRQGVKTLYVEHLPRDVFQGKLDQYNTTGASRNVTDQLNAVDERLALGKHTKYSYSRLLTAARAQKIQVKGLDASTSYDLDGALELPDTPSFSHRSNTLTNFYSHKVIGIDTAQKTDERWIALVEQKRTNTYHGVPGIADLEKTASLRIVDVPTGDPVSIGPDIAGDIAGDPLAKADFRLKLESDYKKPEEPGPSTALPISAQSYSQFDLPAQYAVIYREQMAWPIGKRTFFATAYIETVAPKSQAQNAFKISRTKLGTEAEAFFKTFIPAPRTALEGVRDTITQTEFIDAVFSKTNGLVVGESHAATSSKRFLMDNMKHLAKTSGVKTLYLEHLTTDLHQASLDTLLQTGSMSKPLKEYLKSLDVGHGVPAGSRYSFRTLVERANKYGIRVRAIDCVASLRQDGSPYSRTEVMNYFAMRTIQADQVKHGAHRWVSLVGSAHTNWFQGTPGMVDLMDVVSLHVRDVAPVQAKGISRASRELHPEGSTLDADFRLDIATPGHTPEPAFVAFDRTRLRNIGDYAVEQTSPTDVRILHHSNSGEILETAVQFDDKGFLFIDRWNLKEHRARTLAYLLAALPRGMKRVN